MLKYLTNWKDLVNQALLESPNQEVWEAFRNLLNTALGVAAKNDETQIDEVINVVDLDEKGNLINKWVHKSVMFWFMKMFFDENLNNVRNHW